MIKRPRQIDYLKSLTRINNWEEFNNLDNDLLNGQAAEVNEQIQQSANPGNQNHNVAEKELPKKAEIPIILTTVVKNQNGASHGQNGKQLGEESYKKRKLMQSNYIRMKQDEVWPLQEKYELIDDDVIFLRDFNSDNNFNMKERELEILIEDFEMRSGRDSIITWIDMKDKLKQEYINKYNMDHLERIYNYWKRQRDTFKRPLLRLHWKPLFNEKDMHVAFRPRVAGKMKLRRPAKQNDDDQIIKLRGLREEMCKYKLLVDQIKLREEMKEQQIESNGITFMTEVYRIDKNINYTFGDDQLENIKDLELKKSKIDEKYTFLFKKNENLKGELGKFLDMPGNSRDQQQSFYKDVMKQDKKNYLRVTGSHRDDGLQKNQIVNKPVINDFNGLQSNIGGMQRQNNGLNSSIGTLNGHNAMEADDFMKKKQGEVKDRKPDLKKKKLEQPKEERKEMETLNPQLQPLSSQQQIALQQQQQQQQQQMSNLHQVVTNDYELAAFLANIMLEGFSKDIQIDKVLAGAIDQENINHIFSGQINNSAITQILKLQQQSQQQQQLKLSQQKNAIINNSNKVQISQNPSMPNLNAQQHFTNPNILPESLGQSQQNSNMSEQQPSQSQQQQKKPDQQLQQNNVSMENEGMNEQDDKKRNIIYFKTRLRLGRSNLCNIDRLFEDQDNVRYDDIVSKEANYNIKKMVSKQQQLQLQNNNYGRLNNHSNNLANKSNLSNGNINNSNGNNNVITFSTNNFELYKKQYFLSNIKKFQSLSSLYEDPNCQEEHFGNKNSSYSDNSNSTADELIRNELENKQLKKMISQGLKEFQKKKQILQAEKSSQSQPQPIQNQLQQQQQFCAQMNGLSVSSSQ